jgi:hypothetical protein
VVQDRPAAARAVRAVLVGDGHAVESCALDRASLEDVFVAATLPRKHREAA